MNELIAINKTNINGEEVYAVNPRELWEKLAGFEALHNFVKCFDTGERVRD